MSAIIVWKELKENVLQKGTRGVFTALLNVGVFGVFLPLQMGSAWVASPLSILVWSWVPLLLSASIVSDAFAGERERHTLETLLSTRLSDSSILIGKTLAAVLYGWLIMVLGLALSLVTLNVTRPGGALIVPDPILMVAILVISFLLCWLATLVGVQVSLRSSTVVRAQQILGLGTMGTIFGLAYGVQYLPRGMLLGLVEFLSTHSYLEVGAAATVALIAVDALATWLSLRGFRRGRLVF